MIQRVSQRRGFRTGAAATNLLLALAAFAAVLLLAEITVRILYHPENLGTVFHFDPHVGWKLKPNSTLRSVDHQHDLDYLIHINSLGMRERETTLRKPKGTKRILILGDSGVFGTGVNEEWRFSDFMHRALGEEIEVLNAGVPGWGPDQELIYYERFARKLEPDIVVIALTVANDIINTMLDYLYLGSAPKPQFVLDADTLVLTGSQIAEPDLWRQPLLKKIARKSRLAFFCKRRIDEWKYKRQALHAPEWLPPRIARGSLESSLSDWTVYEKHLLENFEDGWRITERVLLRLDRECRQNGAELIVLAIPMQIEVDIPWRIDVLDHVKVDPERFDFEKPYRRLKAFCATSGIDYLYPIAQFNDAIELRKLFLTKDGHLNKYGHALMARVLLEHLSDGYHFTYQIAEGDRPFLTDL